MRSSSHKSSSSRSAKASCLVEDVPGLFLGRTVGSIVNEAIVAVAGDVASADDIDTAMRLGANYPIGPIAWGREIGGARVTRILQRLADAEGESIRTASLAVGARRAKKRAAEPRRPSNESRGVGDRCGAHADRALRRRARRRSSRRSRRDRRCARSSSAPASRRERIDDVYFGAANQSGEDNRNVARMAVLLAGLPVEVPGVTINRLCGSSLQAINSAAQAIAFGEGDVMVAGGVESMTRAPYVLPKSRRAVRTQAATLRHRPRLAHDQSRRCRAQWTISLGETAEKVARTLRHHARRARPLRVRIADEVQGGDGARRVRRRNRRRHA